MKILKRFFVLLTILTLTGAGCVTSKQNDLSASSTQPLGTSDSGAQWVTYSSFQGMNTKFDPEKISDGSNSSGQNTSDNEGDRVSVRQLGLAQFPTNSASATTTRIRTLHNFRLRSGENILIRSVSSTLQWYDKVNSSWDDLKTGYTSDDFDFADNNINTDQSSYTYFGNAVQPFSRWNGGHSILVGAISSGQSSISVASTATFSTTGSVFYCDTTSSYTSITATTFNLSTSTTTSCPSGSGLAQAVEEYTGPTYPRGNIYMEADNRLFISGVTSSTQVVYFSKYGDALTFNNSLVTASTAADAGLFNLAEGGGAVTAMVQDQGSLYFFKHSMVYQATLSDSLYVITPLKTFDQKSQTTGAVNRRSTFTSANGVFYITPDNQIMSLTNVANINYPTIVPISDPILPTTNALDFSDAVGIVFRNKAYFAMKQSSDSGYNNVVLVYNIATNQWDSPIIGWNVGDLSIYQNSSVEEMYVGDDITANTYVVNQTPQDGSFGITANWRSKQYTFDLATGQKYMENVYVEGYIGPATTLNISLLLDEDGYTQIFHTTIKDTDTTYIFNSQTYNIFGLSPFGTRPFGSNIDLSGVKKFRVYLGQNFRQIPFYNAQVEFASDGENQQWQILDYGFLVTPLPVPEARKLYKPFQ